MIIYLLFWLFNFQKITFQVVETTFSVKALSQIYGISSDRNSSAPSVTSIINQIQADHPIWTGFRSDNGTMGHAVVFSGYSSGSRYFNISYMDPNEGFLTMSVTQDGVYQFPYGAVIYTCECYLEITD